jgi:Zn-finger protein
LINSDWSVRFCPSCGGAKISSAPIMASEPKAELLNFKEVKNYFIGLRKNQIFFSYYRCENCFMLYCPWYFSNSQLKELYSDMPDNLLGEDKSVISRTQSGYVKQIARKVSQVDTYLEIGPDIGLVTNAIVKKFHPNTVLLFEPNLSVHSQLELSAKPSKSIKIYPDTHFSESHRPNLIVGVHVYDHLLDPLGELKILFNSSASKSAIAIVVHNEKSVLRKLLNSKWPPFCLQHPQLYSRKTLKDLLERAGWQNITFKSTVNWFSLDYFVKTGASVLGLNPKYFFFVPKIQIPFRLGNMICFAEKLK